MLPEDNHVVDAEEQTIIMNCSLALYGGGVGTVSSSLLPDTALMTNTPRSSFPHTFHSL